MFWLIKLNDFLIIVWLPMMIGGLIVIQRTIGEEHVWLLFVVWGIWMLLIQRVGILCKTILCPRCGKRFTDWFLPLRSNCKNCGLRYGDTVGNEAACNENPEVELDSSLGQFWIIYVFGLPFLFGGLYSIYAGYDTIVGWLGGAAFLSISAIFTVFVKKIAFFFLRKRY